MKLYLSFIKMNLSHFLGFLSLLHAGLEILAFPCNQFAGQEPGSNEDIQDTVCIRFRAAATTKPLSPKQVGVD